MGAEPARHRLSNRLAARLLPDGRRLHLSDGPIDLIVQAFGATDAVRDALHAAAARMDGLLDELCRHLPALRSQAHADSVVLRSPVANRMQMAVAPHAVENFITPMAAVAGAVADEVLAAMVAAAPLDRAFVNNGGDIALHLASGQQFSIGLVDRPERPSLFGSAIIAHDDAVRGIATSGWRGRSFSLGIADAVTVLADCAASADAAATMIANAVDLPGCHAITRVAANTLDPQSDLGERPVTRGVAALDLRDVAAALASGAHVAARLIDDRLIISAALHLQGVTRLVP